LTHELEQLAPVQSIIAYTNVVSTAIPPEYLDKAEQEQFFSEHYSRIVIDTTTETEGAEAFDFVEDVQSIAEKYYGDEYYATGESITLYDMKHIVEKDNT